MQLWFNSDSPPGDSGQKVDMNVVTLSEAFHQEIDQHRIPLEREAVACFAHTPGTLDFYIWLVWKCWTVHRTLIRIPLFGRQGLGEQLGTIEYSAGRFFRRKLERWLRQVKIAWPECPAAITDDGQALLVWSSKTCPAVQLTGSRARGRIVPSPDRLAAFCNVNP
jgi:hypothetical protein